MTAKQAMRWKLTWLQCIHIGAVGHGFGAVGKGELIEDDVRRFQSCAYIWFQWSRFHLRIFRHLSSGHHGSQLGKHIRLCKKPLTSLHRQIQIPSLKNSCKAPSQIRVGLPLYSGGQQAAKAAEGISFKSSVSSPCISI